MTTHHPLLLAGAELWLLAEKALYWPERQTLLVADAHFGKSAAYRRLGQPVPHGTTAADLARLDGLLARHVVRRLVFLGDFLHAPEARTAATLAALAAWRERHAACEMVLVRGNHDRRAGDPPAEWGFAVVGEPLLCDPFALCHEPATHPTHHVLAGHLHPAFRLHGRGRQSVRLPCFRIGERQSLLPAFGGFTGGLEVLPAAGERIFLVGDGHVWPLA